MPECHTMPATKEDKRTKWHPRGELKEKATKPNQFNWIDLNSKNWIQVANWPKSRKGLVICKDLCKIRF